MLIPFRYCFYQLSYSNYWENAEVQQSAVGSGYQDQMPTCCKPRMQSVDMGVYGIGDGVRDYPIWSYRTVSKRRCLQDLNMRNIDVDQWIENDIRAGRNGDLGRLNFSYLGNSNTYWVESRRSELPTHIGLYHTNISIQLPMATPFLIILMVVLTPHSQCVVATKKGKASKETLPMVQPSTVCVLLVSSVQLSVVKYFCLLVSKLCLSTIFAIIKIACGNKVIHFRTHIGV